jgi:hypothetical protein
VIAIDRASWEGEDPVVDIRKIRILVRPPFVTGDILGLANVSLHALARRVERGGSSGLSPILTDLAAIAAAYDRILQGPNAFHLLVASGEWIGVVMASPDGRPTLSIRTFMQRR